MWSPDGVNRVIVGAVMVFVLSVLAAAQAPMRGTATPAPARGATPSAASHVESNLAQLMRGIVFPSSNVVFAAQMI